MKARVDIDSRLATHYLTEIVRRGNSLPLRRMVVIGQRSVLRNFHEQGRPDRWAPLAESTRESRDRKTKRTARGRRRLKQSGGSYSILQDTGDLKRSVDYKMLGRTNFMVFTNQKSRAGHPYPVYLQYGTKHMPARPFMVWQEEDIKEINKILMNHVIGMRG